ncbi:prolyl-tRNA synthetase associated domain-containing protein [Paratractidigestivibacter sp.]|uniref:prolyl-tRNA synthetase associated domain-containing protein n=1 Tax=Paratractidigestivibacter sp. TaxID=2847316 RepID=UPI002AC95B69|nr:prolyl-tRNA synthetase associated domain-containing protein [Paratractidigestivibacter sp.]
MAGAQTGTQETRRIWEDGRTIPGALTKADIYALLDARGVEYEAVEHPPVFTVEEAQATAKLPFAEHEAKNLFLRDPKHRNYYLVTVPENKAVDLKALQERLGSKRLSFASAGDLAEKVGIYPGSVSPFCALNDEARAVQVALDADFERWGWIGCHPCSNTASVHLRTADLETILRDHGSPFTYIEL